MKTYLESEETRQRVQRAISDLADIVGKTLGPGGKAVLMEQGDDKPPLATKDGVTVSRFHRPEGDIERVVTDAAREVCERTNQSCGDGTTTAIVLADAFVHAGHAWMDQQPEQYSSQKLSRELRKIFNERIKPDILSAARPIKSLPIKESKEIVRYVALVSSNNDNEIADSVAEAVGYVGEDGMIHAEEGTGQETEVRKEDGFPFNGGLSDLGGSASSAFVNRNDYGDCLIEGAYVALYDGEVNDVNVIAPVMERVASEVDGDGNRVRQPLVVFAHGFSDQVFKMMAQNFKRGTLTVVPVVTKSTGQHQGRSAFLWDVAAYVGTKVFDPQGNPIQSAPIPALGFVESLKYGQRESILLGSPDQETIEERIKQLKNQMEEASEFDKDLLRYRIGRLTGGVATIYAGGRTGLEAKERHARVIDAISSVRSAMEMGVVPGGGAFLSKLGECLEKEAPGPVKIFAEALQEPMTQILNNAGVDEDKVIKKIGHPVGDKTNFMVYDALERTIVEWWSAGIMDPAKVAITAIENALSVATLLMTLGGVIVENRSEAEQQVKTMQEGLMQAANEGAF
jgi:chaperonin GroEL